MTKDLRESIMVDIKGIMNDNMKELMKEITVTVKSKNIVESMKKQAVNNNQTNLTPTSQQEQSPKTHHKQQLEKYLNNIIEEIDIERRSIKEKHQHLSAK